MEPHTTPINLTDDLMPGQLVLHSELGVARYVKTWTNKEGIQLTFKFAEGIVLFFSYKDLYKVQVIHLAEGSEQPLLDRIGYKKQEWMRFLNGMRDGTLLQHYVTNMTAESELLPGQLLLHRRHGLSEYRGSKTMDDKHVLQCQFANGWMQDLPNDDEDSFQIVHIDPASGRHPALDRFPKQNVEWERFLYKERGRRKLAPKQGKTPQITRIAIKESTRHEVWRRDEGKCVRCENREKLEFDHIVPISKGGSNTARNIELLCEACNRKKGARI
jgi:hypothetical protein